MYDFFLYTHSGIRWISLLLAVVLVVKSLIGVISKSSYQKIDKTLTTAFVGSMHLQFLLGLILYFFLSPITTNALKHMKLAMKTDVTRFWAVEHITIMIAAVALAQVGSTLSKKAKSNPDKFKKQLIFFGLSLLAMLAGIPWDRL